MSRWRRFEAARLAALDAGSPGGWRRWFPERCWLRRAPLHLKVKELLRAENSWLLPAASRPRMLENLRRRDWSPWLTHMGVGRYST